jgi:hypothetical protein
VVIFLLLFFESNSEFALGLCSVFFLGFAQRSVTRAYRSGRWLDLVPWLCLLLPLVIFNRGEDFLLPAMVIERLGLRVRMSLLLSWEVRRGSSELASVQTSRQGSPHASTGSFSHNRKFSLLSPLFFDHKKQV